MENQSVGMGRKDPQRQYPSDTLTAMAPVRRVSIHDIREALNGLNIQANQINNTCGVLTRTLVGDVSVSGPTPNKEPQSVLEVVLALILATDSVLGDVKRNQELMAEVVLTPSEVKDILSQ